jgi:hypothetical protein
VSTTKPTLQVKALSEETKNGKTVPDSPLNIEVTTVTPDMAANWLARGGKNRKLNERRVDALVAAIHRGEWRLTGEAIKLDLNGQVRDGQHRLQAVVKSGVPIKTVVIRGVDEPAFDVMDVGRPRTAGDVLSMHGYAYHNAVAGAVRLLLFMERAGRFSPTREAERFITSTTTLDYLNAHDDVNNGIRLADRVRKAGLQGGISTWGALFTLFLRIDAEQAYQFAHHLATGEDMSAGHPALQLRNRLRFRKAGEHQKADASREQMAAMTIKAWNAFRKGQVIQMLYWRDDGPKAEAFPRPV